MRNVKGGHLFVLGLLLVGVIGTSLMTDMPVPMENVDAWPHHDCCRYVRVWKQISTSTTWAEIRTGEFEDEVTYGWVREHRCDPFWHLEVWPHGNPCPDE